jgi:hypothetical protein
VSQDPFLSRWSRLKKASAKAAPVSDVAPGVEARPAAPVAVPGSQPPGEAPAQAEREAALPPVESLTPESDFAPFMRAKVEESVKRRALKTLFQDPRFNVMDGLDVYIDDYSRADPLPDGWLEKMSQMAHLGDQPARIEEERKAAEEARAAGAAPAETVKRSLADEAPATSAEPVQSDTSAAADSASPVGESQREGDRLR